MKGEWSQLSQRNNHQWMIRAIRDQGSQILKTWLHHSHWTLALGCVQGKIQPGRNVLSVNLGCSLRIMTSYSPVGGYYIVKDPNNYNRVWLVNFTISADVKSMFQCFTWLSLDGIVQSDWLHNQSVLFHTAIFVTGYIIMYQMKKKRQSSFTGVQPYTRDTAEVISTYWWET